MLCRPTGPPKLSKFISERAFSDQPLDDLTIDPGEGPAIDDKDAAEEEAETGGRPARDPVQIYLLKMGAVPLLSREGEVEVAKRLEEGKRLVLQAVLSSAAV